MRVRWPWVWRTEMEARLRAEQQYYIGIVPEAHALQIGGRIVIPRRFLRATLAADVLMRNCVHGFALTKYCSECSCTVRHKERAQQEACGVCRWAADKYPRGIEVPSDDDEARLRASEPAWWDAKNEPETPVEPMLARIHERVVKP